MTRIHSSVFRSFLALVLAMAGITTAVAATATPAAAASICYNKYGSSWNVGNKSHWWGAAAASRYQGTRMVLDVQGPWTDDGTQTHIWQWYNGASQHWCLNKTVYSNGSASYLLRNYSTGKCLRAWGSTANGTLVKQQTCNTGDRYQHWAQDYLGKVSTPDGSVSAYQWRKDDTNQCLDVQAEGTSSGSRIQLWSCKGGGNQAWY